MWDPYYLPKPFYKRWWFNCLAALFFIGLIVVAVGGIYWMRMESQYQAKVARFDMSKLQDMESASTIYDRDNNVMTRIFLENRDPVAIQDLPGELTQAVVAAEDNRFFQHHGVDYYGMFRAALKNYRSGRIRQGASTLTQQLARNTFGLHERTYDRKLLEIFLAQEIERHYSKEKILEMYLNRVYFGAGFYGVEAAARGYFGKSAKELNLSECATLTGLLKNPNNLSPWSNRQACIEQRNFVLGRMLELKMINKDQYQATIHENLVVKNRRVIHADSYAIDLIRQQVDSLVGNASAVSDGYRIYTTIDPALQKTAIESLQEELSSIEERKDFQNHQTYGEYDRLYKQQRMRKENEGETAGPALAGPEYLQGAVVVLDNATGGILALVGGRDFNHSQFDRALSSPRPAGTAFLPIDFAAAFEKGIFPGSLFNDEALDNRQVMIGGTFGILGEWGPERVDNRYEGLIPARAVLVKSKNAATVRLGMQTGIDNVITLAKKAGISSPLRHFPATFLGSSEVSLMDLTLAYTMFPDGGWRPGKPFIIKRIEDKEGNEVFRAAGERVQVIEPATAYEVHSCLSEALDRGTGDKAYSQYGLKKFPLGGKTGTAYNFTDDWFLGYSSAITCGVWVGFDKPQTIYRGAFSNDVALPIWTKIMNSSFSAYTPNEFPVPDSLKKYEICTKSGLLATDKCFETTIDPASGESIVHKTTYYELATEAQAPKRYCDIHGAAGQLLTQQQQQQQPAAQPAPSPSPAAGGQQQWPRAALAVDVATVSPVQIKSQTLIGADDPYGSIKPAATPEPAPQTDGTGGAGSPAVANANSGQTPAAAKSPGEVEIRRAEPARPADQTPDESKIKIEPPAPLEF